MKKEFPHRTYFSIIYVSQTPASMMYNSKNYYTLTQNIEYYHSKVNWHSYEIASNLKFSQTPHLHYSGTCHFCDAHRYLEVKCFLIAPLRNVLLSNMSV